MKKAIIVVFSFLASIPVFAGKLTFTVDDVIKHTSSSDYNGDLLSSSKGRACIQMAINMINSDTAPKGISDIYGYKFHFNDDGYTKSVIAHYCGGTAHWANMDPELQEFYLSMLAMSGGFGGEVAKDFSSKLFKGIQLEAQSQTKVKSLRSMTVTTIMKNLDLYSDKAE